MARGTADPTTRQRDTTTSALPGVIVRQRREARGLSYVRFDHASRALANDDPDRYARVSSSRLNTLELTNFARVRNPKLISTIVALLWDGDIQAFLRDTHLTALQAGILMPDETVENITHPHVPAYLEGENVREMKARLVTPRYTCDFVMVTRSNRMAPVLLPGHEAGCAHDAVAQRGDLAVLRTERGLRFGFTLGDGVFHDFHDNGRAREFRLRDTESVYGLVIWHTPRGIPDPRVNPIA